MSETGLATFEQLVSASGKRRFCETTLPVSGVRVRLRSLTERELSAYQARVVSAQNDAQRAARLEQANRKLIALCLVDQDGNPLVPAGEDRQLAELDAADTSHLYDECAKHVGINTTDIEDLVKNSEMTPPSDSSTN